MGKELTNRFCTVLTHVQNFNVICIFVMINFRWILTCAIILCSPFLGFLLYLLGEQLINFLCPNNACRLGTEFPNIYFRIIFSVSATLALTTGTLLSFFAAPHKNLQVAIFACILGIILMIPLCMIFWFESLIAPLIFGTFTIFLLKRIVEKHKDGI